MEAEDGKAGAAMNELEVYHKNKYISLRQRIASMKKAALPKPIDRSTTQYTGLIKSTADLRCWAGVPDWKYRCRRCDKGMDKHGLCFDCHQYLSAEGRCFTCYDVIVNTDGCRPTTCVKCDKMTLPSANTHGYKEGGIQSGGLRTNYYQDNTNDDNAKLCEGMT
jgi:hypothetical protein